MKIFDMFGKYSEFSLIIKYKQLDLLKEFSFLNSNLYISKCDFENCEECVFSKVTLIFQLMRDFWFLTILKLTYFMSFLLFMKLVKFFK